jgi:hypothetical protein
VTDEELIRRVMERLPTMPVREREEPVAWRNKNGKDRWQYRERPILINGEPLYTAPPQREWQGLTNEEIEDIRLEYHYADGAVKVGYERAIEAKLREKNS